MKTLPGSLSTFAVSLALFACSSASSNSGGVGGVQSQGGSAGAATGGATPSVGGVFTSGGNVATGGSPGAGGTRSTGGGAATGGASATGGNTPTGGTTATASGVATGGRLATGGSAFATGGSRGGTQSNGGSVPIGGSAAAGGVQTTGGTLTTGGNASATGGSKGGAAPTGGAMPTGGTKATGGLPATGGSTANNSCNASSPLASGDGELTCYYFGQGTSQADSTCTGSKYKTACGYCGGETVSGTAQACSTTVSDTVKNISTGALFAAIAQPYWNSGAYCGMCVSISYGGQTVIATIVDWCASCPENGHLDLSPAAASALGMTYDMGDVKSGVTWKEVACPSPGNIVALCNGSCGAQFYFQGGTYRIVSATAAGHTAQMIVGFWDFGANVVGQTVTLKDDAGNVITGTIPATNGGVVAAAPKCN